MKLLFVSLLCLLCTLRAFAGNCEFRNPNDYKVIKESKLYKLLPEEISVEDISWALEVDFVGEDLKEIMDSREYLELKITYYKSLSTGIEYVSVSGYPGDTRVIEYFVRSSKEEAAYYSDGSFECYID